MTISADKARDRILTVAAGEASERLRKPISRRIVDTPRNDDAILIVLADMVQAERDRCERMVERLIDAASSIKFNEQTATNLTVRVKSQEEIIDKHKQRLNELLDTRQAMQAQIEQLQAVICAQDHNLEIKTKALNEMTNEITALSYQVQTLESSRPDEYPVNDIR